MSFIGDGRGMEQYEADQRYARKGALRLVGLRPFGLQTGRLDTTDRGFFGYHSLTEPIDNLALFYINCHTATSSSESNGSMLTISASVRAYDGSNRNGPWYVTSKDAFTTKIGTKQLVEMDTLFTGFIPSGTNRLAISTRVQCNLGDNVPFGTALGSGGSSEDGQGATVIDSLNPSISSGTIYGPCAIGTYVQGGKRSGVLVLGDSIEAGTGDTLGAGSPHGWAARRLEELKIGYIYAPRSGETAQHWTEYSRHAGRIKLASLVPVAITGWLVNDVTSNRTASQIKADLISIWQNLRKAGVVKIYQKTCVPKTTTSDSFATAANQTNVLTADQQTARNEMNRWLRSGDAITESEGLLSGVFDVAALIEVNSQNELAPEGGLWLTNGTPNAYTGDGLHPSTAAHIMMGSVITPKIAEEWIRGY